MCKRKSLRQGSHTMGKAGAMCKRSGYRMNDNRVTNDITVRANGPRMTCRARPRVLCAAATPSPRSDWSMRWLACCQRNSAYRTRYGVRRANATRPAPLRRPWPQAATPNGDAPAEPCLAWAAQGKRQSGPDRDPLFPSCANTARPAPGWNPRWCGGQFCTLTPVHHLRGAAQDRELSAKGGQISAPSETRAAPRLVHALVRWRSQAMMLAEIIDHFLNQV